MKSRVLHDPAEDSIAHMTKPSPKSPDSSCSYPDCFLCAIKFSPPDIYARQASFFSELFKELPSSSPSSSIDAIAASSKQQLSIIRGLWSTAMAHPDDPLFVQLGVLESMIHLIYKGLRDPLWLSQGDNVFVPYYAAHILGSYTMNVERYAAQAVRYRAVPALTELAGGALSWVEQRVAVRCLSHLASYDSTFPAVSAGGVLRLAMALARGAPGLVYEQFVGRTVDQRLGYHRELLARGSSGEGVEERKGEEWASQLQCWSLQVVNCFALREEFLLAICRPEFLVDLPGMWGGLVNGSSPAGVGLLRTICYHKLGRIAIASCGSIVEALCNVARSSDDWQFMAVDCLLWLLQDPNSRSKVFGKTVVALADLVELTSLGEQENPGEFIMDVLLSQQRQDELLDAGENVLAAIEDVARLKKRIKIERHLAREDIKITQAAALVLRLEGNARFSAGDVRGAATKYSEALEVCPIKAKKDRVVILNNRAQCYLLMGEAERAVSDTTRALSLCRGKRKRHGMTSSLWRRAQAYDMMGLAKESLLDALVFGCSSPSSLSSCSASSTVEDDGWDESGSRSSGGGRRSGVDFYVAKLVRKQMRRTWLFREAARKVETECQPQEDEEEEEEEEDRSNEREEEEEQQNSQQSSDDESGDESEWETASESEIYKSSQRNQRRTRKR